MDKKADQAEADLVTLRVLQLSENPLKGKLNADYLKRINEHIFQDMPKLGFSQYTPGIYRPEVPESKDWVKHRQLDSVDTKLIVGYSNMDKKARDKIDLVLSNVDKYKSMPLPEFSEKITELYVELDYIHPFPDGNSRTLRLFTQQIAKEAGYHIGWEKFNNSDNGRDVLYIARDLSVCEKAIKTVKNEATKRDLYYTLDTFSNNKKLTELLPEVIRPYHAHVFEKFSRSDALKECPELKTAYAIVDRAEQYFQQDKIAEEIKQRVQCSLNKSVAIDKLADSLREKKTNITVDKQKDFER